MSRVTNHWGHPRLLKASTSCHLGVRCFMSWSNQSLNMASWKISVHSWRLEGGQLHTCGGEKKTCKWYTLTTHYKRYYEIIWLQLEGTQKHKLWNSYVGISWWGPRDCQWKNTVFLWVYWICPGWLWLQNRQQTQNVFGTLFICYQMKKCLFSSRWRVAHHCWPWCSSGWYCEKRWAVRQKTEIGWWHQGHHQQVPERLNVWGHWPRRRRYWFGDVQFKASQ